LNEKVSSVVIYIFNGPDGAAVLTNVIDTAGSSVVIYIFNGPDGAAV